VTSPAEENTFAPHPASDAVLERVIKHTKNNVVPTAFIPTTNMSAGMTKAAVRVVWTKTRSNVAMIFMDLRLADAPRMRPVAGKCVLMRRRNAAPTGLGRKTQALHCIYARPPRTAAAETAWTPQPRNAAVTDHTVIKTMVA